MRKKLLALVFAVAIGIAVFAAVGLLSSPQQAEAAHGKFVLAFSGVTNGIKVGGRVSGPDLNNLTGQGFDVPIQFLHRFYCLIELDTSSEAGGVVTLSGQVIKSNFPSDPPSDPSPVIGTAVIFTVDTGPGGAITFKFGAGAVNAGTGQVSLIGH